MTQFRLEPGEFVRLNGRGYRLGPPVAGEGDFLLAPLDGNGGPLAIARAELHDAYTKGNLEFLIQTWSRSVDEGPPPAPPADLSKLSSKIQAIVRRRLAYVTACKQVDDLRWDSLLLGPMLSAVAEAQGDSRPPHLNTVRRWFHDLAAADGDIRALIPNFSRRGGRDRRLDPLVVSTIEAMVERYYLSPERHSGEHVLLMVVAALDRANANRLPANALSHPSRRTIYNFIGKLDPYAVCAARYGRRIADRKFAQSGTAIRPQRPLQRIEIDHTKSDLMVVDDSNRLPIGRPWVTAAIDVYSRMVYGIHVGFTPPSFVSAMRCIRHGILPKATLRTDYPEIENDWPIHGIGEAVVADNGKEFHSANFESAMGQIGTEIVYCSVMDPNGKAPIERFLGSVNRTLLQNQPGSTFSNILDRGDYDPKENAIITFSMFKAILFKWICDVYHVRFHRGLCGVPLKVYQDGIAGCPAPGLPSGIGDMTVLFGAEGEKTIQGSGIQFCGLFYNHPDLSVLRGRHRGCKVRFRYDQEDLGGIHVYDELNGRYLSVPCTNLPYASGLSLWQHRVIRRHARHVAEGAQDISALARAKADIQAMVERSWVKESKTGHKQRMARWLGIEHGGSIESLRREATELPSDESFEAEAMDIPDLLEPSAGEGAWTIETTN